jgi:hypothetical protein
MAVMISRVEYLTVQFLQEDGKRDRFDSRAWMKTRNCSAIRTRSQFSMPREVTAQDLCMILVAGAQPRLPLSGSRQASPDRFA